MSGPIQAYLASLSANERQCSRCGWPAWSHDPSGRHPSPARRLCGSCDAGLPMPCTCLPEPPVEFEVVQ